MGGILLKNLEMEYLINLYSSKTMRRLSGNVKKAYKHCLCGIFLNIISGYHRTAGQEANIKLAEQIGRLIIKPKEIEDLFELVIKNNVYTSLRVKGFKEPFDDKFLNNCISFMRDKLNELNSKNICLFQAKEICQLVDLKKFFKMDFISEFHWLEFNIIKGLIVTVPECIIFNDLKVQWNNYIEVKTYLDKEWKKVKTMEDELEYFRNEINREKMYEFGTLYRSLVFLSVSFVESYLYNLFCCIREIDISGKELIKDILKIDMIQDTQIIEDVLYVLFPDLKEHVGSLYKEYKTINDYRNRYVHASPLIDRSDNTPHLKPLLDTDQNRLIDFLQTSVDLVTKIQSNLPKSLNLLFWWYNDEIIFKEFKKIELTNEKARINRIEYK